MNINEKIASVLMNSLYMTTEQIRDRVKAITGRHYSVEYIGRETRRAAAMGLADFKWFESHYIDEGKEFTTRFKKWRKPAEEFLNV